MPTIAVSCARCGEGEVGTDERDLQRQRPSARRLGAQHSFTVGVQLAPPEPNYATRDPVTSGNARIWCRWTDVNPHLVGQWESSGGDGMV